MPGEVFIFLCICQTAIYSHSINRARSPEIVLLPIKKIVLDKIGHQLSREPIYRDINNRAANTLRSNYLLIYFAICLQINKSLHGVGVMSLKGI